MTPIDIIKELLKLCTDLLRALRAVANSDDYFDRSAVADVAEARYGETMKKILGDEPKGESE